MSGVRKIVVVMMAGICLMAVGCGKKEKKFRGSEKSRDSTRLYRGVACIHTGKSRDGPGKRKDCRLKRRGYRHGQSSAEAVHGKG